MRKGVKNLLLPAAAVDPVTLGSQIMTLFILYYQLHFSSILSSILPTTLSSILSSILLTTFV